MATTTSSSKPDKSAKAAKVAAKKKNAKKRGYAAHIVKVKKKTSSGRMTSAQERIEDVVVKGRYGLVFLELKQPSLDALINAAGLPPLFGYQDLMRRAREGVSIKAIDALKEWAPVTVISNAVAPPTTLSRWRREHQDLRGNAADSTLRLISVIAQAERAFGNAEKARRWLAKPKQTLDPERPGVSPFEMLESEHGARLVEERLNQIAHGHFA
jgi:putative toxin-antitoxin system antitoxin component (TIGR02293 family)